MVLGKTAGNVDEASVSLSCHCSQSGLCYLKSGLEFAIYDSAILFPTDFAKGLSDPPYGGVTHGDIDPTVGRNGQFE